jgi:hypothetical protein
LFLSARKCVAWSHSRTVSIKFLCIFSVQRGCAVLKGCCRFGETRNPLLRSTSTCSKCQGWFLDK